MSHITHSPLNPWWKQASSSSENDVVAHTPDGTKYHPVDAYQSGKAGGAGSRINGATIPRGKHDGSSRGFDHNDVSKVTIYDTRDGGHAPVVVDFKAFRQNRAKANQLISRAIENVGGVSEIGGGRETDEAQFAVFQQIGKPASEVNEFERLPEYLQRSAGATPQTPVRQVHQPAGQIIPHADDNGTQRARVQQPRGPRMEKVATVAETPRPQPVIQHQPQAQPVIEKNSEPVMSPAPAPVQHAPAPQPQPQPAYYPYPPLPVSQTDPALLQTLNAIGQALTTINSRVDQISHQAALPVRQTPPAPEVLADPAERDSVDAMLERMDDVPTPAASLPVRSSSQPQVARTASGSGAVDVIRNVLQMPFLSTDDGRPAKPKDILVFEMGQFGTQQARYHAVIRGAGCIVLVYDTRYEDGNQYVPPVRLSEDEQEAILWVSTPAGAQNKKPKRYKVLSMGTQFSLGVLDVIVLHTMEDGETRAANEDTDD